MNLFYQNFDTQRLDQSHDDPSYRSAFQIDRDRILHTSAFRRLQSKTQVFWSGQFDFYRTRLTHSLEVAQIGRSICHWLLHSSPDLNPDYHIDPDLVEAACLAHDLGHPPFGHSGESTLNQLFASFGGFEGNAQTLRLLTSTIFSQSQRGMNPSRAFLDSILKYKTLHAELHQPDNHFIYNEQSEFLDFALGGRDFPTELTPGPARDAFRSIECQIMDWADDTAYSLNDLADGIQCGFLNLERIERWASSQENLSPDNFSSLDKLLQSIRSQKYEAFLGKRIGDYIQSTHLAPTANFMSQASHRYRWDLIIDPTARAESKLFKRLALQIIFRSPSLQQLENKSRRFLESLFETLAQHYLNDDLLPKKIAPLIAIPLHDQCLMATTIPQRARLLCDYLSSLTDPQATRLYLRLFSPNAGSVTDLLE